MEESVQNGMTSSIVKSKEGLLTSFAIPIQGTWSGQPLLMVPNQLCFDLLKPESKKVVFRPDAEHLMWS